MKTSKFLMSVSLGLLVLSAILLSGCSAAPKAVVLDGADKDAVLAFSEPSTDNLFSGFNAGDYAVFARDFDTDMQKAIDEKGFASLQASITPKIGKYLTRTVSSVEQVGEHYRLIYRAEFEQDANVKVTLVFRMAEPHQVAGLFFNSSKLK